MSLADSILRVATRAPGTVAIRDGERTLTYGELVQASGTLMHLLSQRGVQPGRVLAMRMPNSMEAVASILAGLRLGTDLLLADPALKAAELLESCRKTGVLAVLGLAPCPDLPAGLCWQVPWVEELLAQGAPAPLPDLEGGPSAQSFLLHSSGTTGAPKIVRRTMAQAEAAVRIFEAELPCLASDRVLAALPFFHSFGLLFTLLVTLRAGGALHLDAFSPRATAAAIAREGITVLPATPFMFRLLAETRFEEGPSLASVRLALSAGSGLPVAVAEAFKNRFGLGIHQSYVSTESGPVALGRPECYQPVPGWAGRLYRGVVLEFAGADPGSSGSQGRAIIVKSAGNASGYAGEPLASAEVFRNGAVHIGDLGRLDEAGDLHILGRERPMLNVAGKKVSPAEVEACLKAHPGIDDAVVTGVPAPDGGSRIRATLAASSALTIQEVQTFVASRLADFKVPRDIVFSDPEQRTTLGKARHPRMGQHNQEGTSLLLDHKGQGHD